MKIMKLFDRYAKQSDSFQLKAFEVQAKYKKMQKELTGGIEQTVFWEYVDRTGSGSGGDTRDNMDGTMSVNIDCPILSKLDAGENVGRTVIPGRDIVRQTVAHCHEKEHILQFVDARQPNGDPIQALRLVCSRFNPFWYRGDKDGYQQNYWHDSTEIRAERSGIAFSRDMLKSMFPRSTDEERERAILEYVESRCFIVDEKGSRVEQADYFIQLPMNWNMERPSVDQILKLFDKAAVEVKSYAPKYNILDRTCSFINGRCRGDEFCQTVYVPSDRRSPWEIPYYMLDKAKDEQGAVYVVGAVTLMNHPELFKVYQALEQIHEQLSPDVIFGKGFLERVTAYDKERKAASPYLSVQIVDLDNIIQDRKEDIVET